eukprot:CAMPEP_0195519158 /NCGR_PEP_ID=MMETSP0794_2-20130614/14478_1 /TAXON_ID=515487 /ORGANISM="Stephanopyxis turris, Strain CCMP 815" /LENGTH=562 /DNA_ID=CAMNT_0040648269 /DNA_START=231 /DNA_END=1916 /DNA_ORIENTATION=+
MAFFANDSNGNNSSSESRGLSDGALNRDPGYGNHFLNKLSHPFKKCRHGSSVVEYQSRRDQHEMQTQNENKVNAKAMMNERVALMVGMGFSAKLATKALKRTQGELDSAIAWVGSLNDASNTRNAHIPASKLAGMKSADIVDHWCGNIDDNDNNNEGKSTFALASASSSSSSSSASMIAITPEYRKAYDDIVIARSIMSSSSSAKTIKNLDEAYGKLLRKQFCSFQQTCQLCIKTAFGLSSEHKARNHWADVAGIAQGQVFPCMLQYHDSLSSWHQRYTHFSLLTLTKRVTDKDMEPFELQQIIALILRGNMECHARKLWVFTQILTVVGQSKQSTFASNSISGTRVGRGSEKDYLYVALYQMIDSYKEQAFRTVFVVPTEVYFSKVHDDTMAGDADVHGGNSYLAILMATLSIKMNRLPMMHDESKGVADFLSSGGTFVNEWVAKLWLDKNLGKEAGAVHAQASIQRGVPRNQFCVDQCHNAVTLANLCVDERGSTVEQRRRVAKYLEQFAHYFSFDFIVPKMVNHILQDDALAKAANIVCSEMLGKNTVPSQTLFRDHMW